MKQLKSALFALSGLAIVAVFTCSSAGVRIAHGSDRPGNNEFYEMRSDGSNQGGQAGTAVAQSSAWTQWGGPHGNFKTEAKGLATSWPETGPPRLWSRELGDGYSSILVEKDQLYTMYRKGEQDVVIAMSAASGKTTWEFAYDAPFTDQYVLAQGPGPRATPLLAGDFLYAVGATGKFHCLNKKTGKLVWSHDLFTELKGFVRARGYTCSPIAYKNTVILLVGAAGGSVMAFNQKTGAIVWKRHDYKLAYASPILINVSGQDQLVAYMLEELIGVDPNDGTLLWRYPHKNSEGVNASTPVWGDDNLLFCSSAYDGGSAVIKLTRTSDKTSVQEVWSHRVMRMHFGNVIRVGDTLYGSSGDMGPTPLTALDVKTGQLLWRDRSLAKSALVYADDRFIAIDEDGNLIMATLTPSGVKLHAKVELLKNNAWTPPTLVGTTLYVRDRKSIMALDLK
jgi:outer membrane protein assembly factor BamB